MTITMEKCNKNKKKNKIEVDTNIIAFTSIIII